jgi:hypothetical protein
MRYIEINKRDVYLRSDPQLGPVVVGEVPDCGPDCNANLSQMLLEYTMSCEDCRDQATTARYIDHFGDNLGEKLIARLYDVVPETAGLDRLSEVMDIILNSMGVEFQKDLTVDHLRYDLAHGPIHETARNSGVTLWVAAAQSAFVALCRRVIQTLAPEWELVQPAEVETEVPLDTILIARN